MTTQEIDEEIKDFTRVRKPIRFKIDGDIFDAVKALPAGLIIRFSIAAERISEAKAEERGEVFKELFGMVLKPDSLKLFMERMNDVENPIDFEQINEIIPYLFEKYGLRPTEQPSDSSTGSDNQADGMSSGENASSQGLNLVRSQPTNS